MAVLSVTELGNASGSIDQRLQKRFDKRYRVLTDDALDGLPVVLSASGLPSVFDLYTDPNGNLVVGCICTDLQASQDENPYVWEVVATFSTLAADPSKQEELPTRRPPEIRWSTTQYQRVIQQDGIGFPIQNSAREPFDPPVEVDDSRPTLHISRYQSSFDPNVMSDYKNAVNSDTFFGFAPGTVMCKGISAASHYENGVFCWKVDYEFHMRPDGWQLKLLDQGYRTFNRDTNKWETIIASDGTLLSSPTLLNGYGKELRLARTFIVNGLDDDDEQFEVDDTTNFPLTPYFIEVPETGEVMRVKEHTDATHIIAERGVMGTTATAVSGGTYYRQMPYFLEYEVYPSVPFSPLGLP